MNPREQGDLGERSAICWFLERGAPVAIPVGHSPDWDLLAELGGRILRVQVKTCTQFHGGRWEVQLATRGGNQSWNRLVKRLDSSRCDYVFVLVGDGRRWFVPSCALGGGTKLVLGGPKYAAFEVERGIPIAARPEAGGATRMGAPAHWGDARAAKGDGL